MTVKKVWIHSSITSKKWMSVLEYQEKMLRRTAEDMGMEVIGSSQEVTNDVSLHRQAMEHIITHLCRKDVDCLLIYNRSRVSADERLFSEFQILCDMYAVDLVCLEGLKSNKQ